MTENAGLMKNNPINIAAWAGFINWAAGEEEFITQFEKETNEKYIKPANDPLGAMIDKACGIDKENRLYWLSFCVWITEAYWDDGPLIPDCVEEMKKEIRKNRNLNEDMEIFCKWCKSPIFWSQERRRWFHTKTRVLVCDGADHTAAPNEKIKNANRQPD